jgi:DNA-binding response OmpR family regulator
MESKILIIEDDNSIREMVADYLKKEGFTIYTAENGEDGVIKFMRDTYDLVLLDIMMPKLDGIEVMKIIREKSAVPILLMSAKDTDVDMAIGLGLGADDYIAKPFSMIEITARIKAAIRRATKYSSEGKKEESVIKFRDITIDFDKYSVMKNNNNIILTSKEFDILKLFIKNPNRVFTKAQVYSLVWKDEYFGDENVINVHIRRLREKIEEDASNPQYIKTLWGIGYKLGEV